MVKRRRSLRQGVQHVDRPADVERLPEPGRAGRARGEAEALRIVIRAECGDGISWHGGRCRHLGERPAVRPLELERPVRPTCDLIPLLVHRAMVPSTQEREIRERRGPAMRPVTEMMPLGKSAAAAREATPPVPMGERSSQSRGNRPGPGPDLYQAAFLIVSHHHPAGIQL